MTEVRLFRRPWLSRAARLPRLLWRSYRILRQTNGRLTSASAAWYTSRLLLRRY